MQPFRIVNEPRYVLFFDLNCAYTTFLFRCICASEHNNWMMYSYFLSKLRFIILFPF